MHRQAYHTYQGADQLVYHLHGSQGRLAPDHQEPHQRVACFAFGDHLYVQFKEMQSQHIICDKGCGNIEAANSIAHQG